MREQAQREHLHGQRDLDDLQLSDLEADGRQEAAMSPAVYRQEEHDGPSASEQAYDDEVQLASLEQEDDKHVAELKRKVGLLVERQHGGDYKRAFAAYDADQDGAITKDELIELLDDAGVGNRLTQGRWAKGIIERLDAGEKDKKIQWHEFEAVFKADDANRQARA